MPVIDSAPTDAGASAHPVLPEVDHIVFYDGVCALCDRGMQALIALDTDRRLHFAPLQGETASAFGIEWDENAPEWDQSFVFVDNTGDEPVVHERTAAVRAELEAIDRLPLLAGLLRVLPRPIADLQYRVVAATRYRLFGRYDECRLPPDHVRERFLP